MKVIHRRGFKARPLTQHQSGEIPQYSVVSSLLSKFEDLEKRGYNETGIRDVAGIMFAGKLLSLLGSH